MQDFSPQRYDKMIYRKCGRWGLKLPAVSLGAWETYGGYRGEETARQCMFRAFDLGITHFDLANNYGKPPGNAESLVGKILKEMPRNEIIISSKAGYTMWPGPYRRLGFAQYLMASLDQSLGRLGLDYVDIFYHHRPDPETPLEETLGAWTTSSAAARRYTPGSRTTPARWPIPPAGWSPRGAGRRSSFTSRVTISWNERWKRTWSRWQRPAGSA